ncbi:uncharacterized protein [Montipora foliosa]|uniref:uncharacterized protein isoform X3 n=1 Tax=Montipora foliosa TaxID=591990 RepID=UPI0035F1FF83
MNTRTGCQSRISFLSARESFMKVDVSENKSPRLNRCRGILSQRFPLKTALPPYVASSRSKRSFHLLQFSVFRGIDYLSCSEILHFTQEPLPLSF